MHGAREMRDESAIDGVLSDDLSLPQISVQLK